MSTTEGVQTAKRKRGRPSKAEQAARLAATKATEGTQGDSPVVEVQSSRNRVRKPLAGSRDVLTVEFSPEFRAKYSPRWVKDSDQMGARIQRFLSAGWEFVGQHEVGNVGQDSIHYKAQQGSVIRVPAGGEYTPQGEPVYLYLMKIPLEYYNEDFAAKQQLVDKDEAAILNSFKEAEGDAVYGQIKISR